jgi:hypothetical protein
MAEHLSNETLPLSRRAQFPDSPAWPSQGTFAISEGMHSFDWANPNFFSEGPALALSHYVTREPQTAREAQREPSFRGRITAPVRALLSLFDRWQLGDQSGANLLGASEAQFVNDLRVGTASLSTKDMQDRARLLLRIYEGVHSLLRQPEAERSWINMPIPALGNRTILEMML